MDKFKYKIKTIKSKMLSEWGLLLEDLHDMLKDSVPQVLFCKEKGKTEITMSYYLDSKYSQMITK
jgi:hypothetical protein